jgi:hypothetical protein
MVKVLVVDAVRHSPSASLRETGFEVSCKPFMRFMVKALVVAAVESRFAEPVISYQDFLNDLKAHGKLLFKSST